MPIASLPSAAKINLLLHVTGRRADGYHLLQSVFVPLAWGDQIQMTLPSEPAKACTHKDKPLSELITRHGDFGVAFEDDLMVKAAKAFFEEVQAAFPFEFGIHKVLPMGGGLGGGSSNAATVLKALQAALNNPVPSDKLTEIALKLGADVPFFMQPHAAIVEGIGEQIAPLVLPPWHYVIVCPSVHVPTADIFRSPDLKRDTAPFTHDQIAQELGAQVYADAPEQVKLMGHNDLETVACRLFPQLQSIKQQAWEEGGVHLRMSGSGSSFFAVFKTQQAAQSALQRLEKLPLAWRAAVCTQQA